MDNLHKEFTVCYVFSHDLKNVVLVTKARTEFKGRLNGPGGELEDNETPYMCALRELQEETGVTCDNLIAQPTGVWLEWLGTLTLPHNCKYPALSNSDLYAAKVHFFAGQLTEAASPQTQEGCEEVGLYPVDEALASPVTCIKYAGDGDLQYFMYAGLRALGGSIPTTD